MQSVGLREAARQLGLSHVALLRAERDGRINRLPGGGYDVLACRIALAENTNPGKSKSAKAQQRADPESPLVRQVVRGTDGTEPNGLSLAEAARQYEWEKLREKKLKTDREEGRLADVSAVNSFVAGMIMKARDELTRIGSELGDQLAAETVGFKCAKLVDDRIYQVLEKLSEYKSPV